MVVTLNDETEIEVEFHSLGDRLGALPRKIYFKDGSVFECADNDAVDRAFGKSDHFFSRLARAERSLKFAVVAVVVTIVSIFVVYQYGIPAAAYVVAHGTPASAVKLIDSSVLDTVDRTLFEPSSLEEERKQEIQQLFAELKEVSGEKDLPLQLLFRDGGRLGANAVALPGGTIILTDQLEALAQSDDEIAGVLAHEIGHVAERHSLRQIYRALGVAFLASVVVGDSSQLFEEVIAQAALLETLSYSRKFELDADVHSVELMVLVDRDPVAFVDLLDRLLEKHGLDTDRDTSWLDTHPGNKDRRENVQNQIDQLER